MFIKTIKTASHYVATKVNSYFNKHYMAVTFENILVRTMSINE